MVQCNHLPFLVSDGFRCCTTTPLALLSLSVPYVYRLPVCPIYTLLRVLHCSLCIPLGFVLLVFYFYSCCWVVLVVLKAMIMFVSLNRFVILLIMGLKYVKVVHFFDCSFLCSCVSL